MTMIKAAAKAAGPINIQQMTNAEVLQKVAELKAQLALQKQKLSNVEGLSQFSMEMQAEHAGTLAMIEAEETLLANYETFLKTGIYPDGTQADFGAIQEAMSGRKAGWNDTTGMIEPKMFQSDKEKVGANYAGTILLENSGAYDPANPDLSNMLAFVAGDDPDLMPVAAKTVGTDIHVKVASGKIYVLKNMASRPEDLVFYFGDVEGPVEFDASQVVRVSDGNWGADFGETFGLIIYGSAGDDRIVGSQGADVIMGSAGDDKIFGVGGDDRLYGDDFNEIGASGFGVDDGNDLIDGGAGINLMKAGGGDADKIIGAGGSEHENPGATQLYDQPDPATFISPAVDPVYKEGTLILDADKVGSNLQITMPPGYTMASAEPSPDHQALVITMAGFDVNGDPHTIRVKIKGFFDPKNAFTFTFQGNDLNNIIDFSAVTLPAGVQANINGGKGDDTLMAPTTKLDSLGVDAEDLGKPTISEADAQKIVDQKRFGDVLSEKLDGKSIRAMDWGITEGTAEGFEWQHMNETTSGAFVNSAGEILLTPAANTPSPKVLNFTSPDGYKDAVLIDAHDGTGDQLLVFIRHTVDGTEQVVVRLRNLDPATAILVNGAPVQQIAATSVVDGGLGYDTIYGSVSSTSAAAEELVQGTYPFDPEIAIADNTTLSAKIEAAEEALTKTQTDLTDALQEKKDLLKEIADAKDDIKAGLEEDLKALESKIAGLNKLEGTQEAELAALEKQQAGE